MYVLLGVVLSFILLARSWQIICNVDVHVDEYNTTRVDQAAAPEIRVPTPPTFDVRAVVVFGPRCIDACFLRRQLPSWTDGIMAQSVVASRNNRKL